MSSPRARLCCVACCGGGRARRVVACARLGRVEYGCRHMCRRSCGVRVIFCGGDVEDQLRKDQLPRGFDSCVPYKESRPSIAVFAFPDNGADAFFFNRFQKQIFLASFVVVAR